MARFTGQEERFMQQVLSLAAQGRGETSPNPMVGCVIVRQDKIVAKGYHHQAGGPHAEVVALNEAKGAAKGATLFVNLEPCCHQGKTPPCVKAIIEAGVTEVVAAMYDPNQKVHKRGVRALRKAGIKVRVGLLEEQARQLNEAFVTFHALQRPFVIAKWAMTLDGRTAADSGSSKWITTPASRMYVHELRSQVDAIMVGIGTVIQDNPQLNVRVPNYKGRHPYRVIIDGHLKVPTRCNCLMLDQGGPAIIIATDLANKKRVRALREFGHTVIVVGGTHGNVLLEEALSKLYEHNVQSLFVEGGKQIHTSLLERGLVDKVVCFIAPKIVGGLQRNPIEGWGKSDMQDALQLERTVFRSFEEDVCIEGYINHQT